MASEIISTVVDGFVGITTGLSSAVVNTFNGLFVTETGGLTNIAVWGLVLVSVGFGFGLLKKFTNIASK